MVFNATFNNISVISWWSVLLVEETKSTNKTDCHDINEILLSGVKHHNPNPVESGVKHHNPNPCLY
jgi:hypothetical protein